MSLIFAYQSRGVTKDLTVLDALGNVITPGSNDKLRVIIGREGQLGIDLADAELVVTSDAATVNGSSLTIGGGNDGRHRLRLDASDLAFPPGVYTFFFDYLDVADQTEWKNIDRQVFNLEES